MLLVSRKETRGVSFETSENNDNNKEIISSNILMSIRMHELRVHDYCNTTYTLDRTNDSYIRNIMSTLCVKERCFMIVKQEHEEIN